MLEMTENPRHRFMPQVEHPVYHFNLLGEKLVLSGRDEVEAVYREWTESNQCIFYVEDEQLAVGDRMIVSRSLMYQQTPGAVLAASGVDADENATYLAKSREAMIWPYDERGRLIGEDVCRAGAGGRAHL